MKKIIEYAGWIYFVLCLIGSVLLVIKAIGHDLMHDVIINSNFIIYSIALLLQTGIILIISLALSDILEQNQLIILIINPGKGDTKNISRN